MTKTQTHTNAHREVTNDFLTRWEQGNRHAAISELVLKLGEVRREMSVDEWKTVASRVSEEVAAFTNQDPFSKRCVDKPRGYAGDALTLDLIYGHPRVDSIVRGASSTGRTIFTCTTNAAAAVGVRKRRQVLADAIDVAAEQFDSPSVMSLACGHLREAEVSWALRTQQIDTFYAVDQDGESLAEVAASYGHYGIQTVKLGVRELLKGARPARDLSLAYTAGLYDYLPDDVAQATTAAMFDMLAPGAKVLIANFHTSLPSNAYMEACMDWWLIYRDEDDVTRLFDTIDPDQIEDIRIWTDHEGHIVYGEAVKKG